MNNSQVAHVWAQQKKESARGSNFYFEGPTIYSYGPHFPIATFHAPGVVLFTTDSYSMSTSKHIGYARRALSGVSVFNVPDLQPHGEHARNREHYRDAFNAQILRASRARSNAEWLLQTAREYQQESARYCEFFNLPDFLAGVEISPELLASAKAASAKAAQEKRADNAERERVNALREEDARAEWRAGTLRQLPWDYQDKGATMLRVVGAEVETSRGARVPLADARNLWTIVRDYAAIGKTYARKPGGAPIVGEFELLAIAANGDVTIGCHELTFTETRAFAIAQGWNV